MTTATLDLPLNVTLVAMDKAPDGNSLLQLLDNLIVVDRDDSEEVDG